MNNPTVIKMALAPTSPALLLIFLLLAIPQGVSGKWTVYMASYEICAVPGSSVVIPCTFSHPPDLTVTKVYWGINAIPRQELPDLISLPQYKGRVHYDTDKRGTCTLTLSDVRVADTAGYYARIETETKGERWLSAKVSLSIKDIAELVVQTSGEAIEGRQITMTCKSCVLPKNSKILWRKDGEILPHTQTNRNELRLRSIRIEDEGEYSCALEGQEDRPSPPVKLNVMYPPKNTSVSVSPVHQILEGSSVTLSCSSDANPQVDSYTWYKEGATSILGIWRTYWFSSVSSYHTGYYYCAVQNQFGGSNSSAVYLDVQYAPKNISASVRLSGDIMDGTSVTLTCSGDANPPVQSYTWYKRSESGMLNISTQQNYSISIVSSEHTGYYYCQAENKRGHTNSTDVHLNVLYAPREALASFNHTGDLVKGTSVTLSCRSDANPPVENYTWYKRTGDETTAVGSGETITVTLTSSTAGFYHCEAKNRFGSQNSAAVDLPLAGWLHIALIAAGVAVVFLIALALVMFRKRKTSSDTDSRTEACYQAAVDNDYVNVNPTNADHNESEDTSSDETSSDDTSSEDSSDTSSEDSSEDSSDDVKYITVQFKSPPTQQGASRSTNPKPKRSKAQRKQQQQNEEEVEYTMVNFSRHTAATNTTAETDIYSVVNKPKKNKN